VRHTAVLGTGGVRISRDLARDLGIPEPAEQELKDRHGALDGARPNRMVGAGGDPESPSVSTEELGARIEEHLGELLMRVAREARKNIFGDLFTAGVVLTGGGSLFPGLSGFAERLFELPVRRGVPRGLPGAREAIEDPRLTAAVALAVWRGQGEPRSRWFAAPLVSRLPVPVRRWLGEAG
jgi:cell division protein FtsA